MEIAHLLLEANSAIRDEKRGVEFAEACFAKGHAACATALGKYFSFWRTAADENLGVQWFQKGEDAGDWESAYFLGRRAYYGKSGQPRDAGAARRHLEQATMQSNFAGVWLARLDEAEGHRDAALPRLLELSANGNLLARFYLVGLCAGANHCGNAAPTRKSLIGDLHNADNPANVVNNVVWNVATDPLSSREDGELAMSVVDAFNREFSTDWSRIDTHAAALARAGRTGEACSMQKRVIDLAVKAGKETLDKLMQRREAYCHGVTWQDD